ncbi:hypothetical protein [Stenotrophomonas sp.]|uniref:hypothetical protein n=1 Tax=Stenotrophomonas sp. TaxID=69392 RepID=UPI002897940F|nr:hypothetical protein [Stenotrophomonas sp.]
MNLLAAVFVTLTSACSHYAQGHPAASADKMTPAPAAPSKAMAPLHALQLTRQAVHIAVGISSPNEIDRETLASMLGSPAEDLGDGRVGYGGRIDPDWTFTLELSGTAATGKRLDLDFFDSTPSGTASTEAICAMDFDQASSELVRSGFSKATVHGEHGRPVSEAFARPGMEISVDTIRASGAQHTSDKRCIRGLTIKASTTPTAQGPGIAVAKAPDSLSTTPLDAGQLLLGLLDLIQATTSASDLTLERVSAALREPARTFAPGHFGYGGALSPVWSYGLEVKQAGTPDARLDLNFIDTGPQQKAPATAICQVDFNRFATALHAAGFARGTVRGEHGRTIYHRFERGQLSIKVDTIPEHSAANGQAAHDCVRLVSVQ